MPFWFTRLRVLLEHEQIIAGPAFERIGATAIGDQGIIAPAPLEQIHAQRIGGDHVDAAPAVKVRVPRSGGDKVIACAAVHGHVARAREDQIVT